MQTWTRTALLTICLAAPAFSGCSCTYNRQSIYPNGRGRSLGVEAREGVRVSAPGVEVEVQPPTASDPSDSTPAVDVPMLEPRVYRSSADGFTTRRRTEE
ncbi:MAG: hypothetical protein SFX72_12635 [Isosphaeraceae bacterium]|nr:hypothetical protein [Isosphaeraceae bacterium]